MKPARPQIFLSSVSSEFRSNRESLSNDLRGPDSLYAIVEQKDFTVGGGSLLEQLDSYIGGCSAVVHLVGSRAGQAAKPGEVGIFLDRNPQFLDSLPILKSEIGDGRGISYTQWEAYLALHHGVPCFVFVSDSFQKLGEGEDVAEEKPTSQQQHFARLSATGKHYDTFSSPDRLSVKVHRALGKIAAAMPFGALAQPETEMPPWHDRFISEPDLHAPLTARLGLPYHLLAGVAMRVEVGLISIGKGADALEDVTMSVHIGSAVEQWQFAHLPPSAGRTTVGEISVPRDEAGSKTLRVQIGTRRGTLRENYTAEAAVEVISKSEQAVEPAPGHRLPAHLQGGVATPALIHENRRRGTQFAELPLALAGESMEKRLGACKMVLMPVMAAGQTFSMGDPKAELDDSSDEVPHAVRFARGWWVGRFPVSQRQFEELMGHNPSLFAEPSGNLPVESVNWNDAAEFCRKLTEREKEADTLPSGFRYRLPTEAEWEFCCRAGGGPLTYGTATTRRAPGGSSRRRRPSQTLPLDGGRGANRLGLCDMLGNVYEWTADTYALYETAATQHDPICRDEGPRVLRGGCWQDPPEHCRPTLRVACDPDRKSGRIGFRVVLARADG